jgi:hypothetical protein
MHAIRKIALLDALERQRERERRRKTAQAAAARLVTRGVQQEEEKEEEEDEEEEETVLYRGIRGVLPASFYEPDVQGFITAVDYGFTSVSAEQSEATKFMSADEYNVLWVLHCTDGRDSAGQLHHGASLQPLSQFPTEAETLLPPLCMLQVLRVGGAADTTGAFRWEDKQGTNGKGEVVRFKEIHVRPCSV